MNGFQRRIHLSSVDEMPGQEVQDQRSHHKVTECALGAHLSELSVIGGVDLLSEVGQKHELGHVGTEASQEGVKRIVAHQNAEHKLHNTGTKQKGHKQVDCTDPRGRRVVVLPQFLNDFERHEVSCSKPTQPLKTHTHTHARSHIYTLRGSVWDN